MALLALGKRDVGEALQMKAQEPEFQGLFYKGNRLFGEMLLVSHESEDHPDRKMIAKHQLGCEVNGNDHFEPEDDIVNRCKCNLGPPEPHVRIRDIGITVEPLALPLALAVEQLQALNGADALDEIRILFCTCLNGSFRP